MRGSSESRSSVCCKMWRCSRWFTGNAAWWAPVIPVKSLTHKEDVKVALTTKHRKINEFNMCRVALFAIIRQASFCRAESGDGGESRHKTHWKWVKGESKQLCLTECFCGDWVLPLLKFTLSSQRLTSGTNAPHAQASVCRWCCIPHWPLPGPRGHLKFKEGAGKTACTLIVYLLII